MTMTRLGFQFAEQMAGTWTRATDAAERPIRFALQATAPDLVKYARDREVTLTGTIDADGLCVSAPAEGMMVLAPERGLIHYRIEFLGHDARKYRLHGQKELRLTNLVRTLTVLPAEICDIETGAAIGRARLEFDLRTQLLAFLGSWRPRLG
jgi:hypothetical protein